MMGGQQYRGNTMGGYQQSPAQQGTPVTDITHLTIQNFTFQPMHIQVKASTIVTWTNQDNFPHTITFKNGMKDSGPLHQGQTFS